MRPGEVGILNIGCGDTKLVFNKDDPAETIRAGRIVKDLLRRGYALLIEVERDGKKVFQRCLEFREDTCEYIIADLDPVAAERADNEEAAREAEIHAAEDASATQAGEASRAAAPKRGRKTVHASATRAVAVARSAGG